MKLRFTPSAKAELLSGIRYIHDENPDAALKLFNKIDDVLHRLEKHPLSGRSIPEFPELPYREVLINPYRFFYTIKGQTVWIVAVWHMAQLPIEPDQYDA